MGRKNRHKHKQHNPAPVATARRENMLAQGGGANSVQDRGARQYVPAQSTRNPYYQQNFIQRCRDYLKMFNTSWEAQKIITIPVDDAFKYRAELKGISDEDAKELWNIYDDMDLDNQGRRALIQDRLFGGCAAFGVFKMDSPTTEGLKQPLRLRDIQKGDFEALNIFDVTQLSHSQDAYNPFSASYDRLPDLCVGSVPVDHSRLFVLDGNPVVGRYTRKVLEGGRYNRLGFGESKLTTLYEIIKMATGTQEGAYHLVNMSSVLLFEVEGLRTMKATNSEAEETLRQVAENISIYRAAYIDAKKAKISQHAASFGSVPDLLMIFMQLLSAAGDVPATRYLGQAPGGLNATGESDLQNYYNMVRGNVQMTKLKPLQFKVFNWIGCSRWGFDTWMQKRKDFEIDYPELWNESAKEKAERLSIYAAALNNLVANGVIDGETAIKELQKRDFFLTEVEAKVILSENPLEDSPIDANGAIERLKQAARGAKMETPRLPAPKLNADDFDEGKHPRAKDGKFSSTQGSGSEKKTGTAKGKFKSMPEISVSSSEVGKIQKGKGFIGRVIAWAKQHRVIGSFNNADANMDSIQVTASSIRSVISHGSRDGKLALLEAAPELIKSGVFLETNPRNDRGLLSHIFAAKANIDGEQYAVGFVITEDMNGRRYYNHELTSIEKAPGGPRTLDEQSQETATAREPIHNILLKHGIVKSGDNKGGGNG